MRGMLGGYFEELGLKGVLVMAGSGVAVSFAHSYASAKLKAYLKGKYPTMTEAELMYKSELYTGGAMLVPALIWMGMRYTDKLPSSDAWDIGDNIVGADLLWELWNGVETLIAKMEAT
jgi:hypothetical protein